MASAKPGRRLPVRSNDSLYREIREVLNEARLGAYRAVNRAMVEAYWHTGRLIVEYEQQGKRRAAYGEALLEDLSRRLTAEFGRGFDERNLRYMRQFYASFPIRQKLSDESPLVRKLNATRSKSTLSAKRNALRFEDEDFYVDLVFYNYLLKCFLLIDLKVGKLTHQDIGQMDSYVRMFDAHARPDGDNPTIGLILCSRKNEAVAKYSVLSEGKRLFAAEYLKILPTEQELTREIERERRLIESEHGSRSKEIN
jgi:predicted nuclease of restriction endonuclease-like (RecB) superfamily